MRGELGQEVVPITLRGHGAVGDPDALPVEVHLTRLAVAGGLLRACAREERPVKDGQFCPPRWVRDGDGEEAGILVVHTAEVDAVLPKLSKPQALPMQQVLRYGQGDAWAGGRQRRVGHHVASERFDKGDTRVLAAAAAVGPPLVISFGLEHNAEPLHPARVAGSIEQGPGNTNARVIARRNQPREEVKLPIRATGGSRVEDTFGLQRVARFRLHHLPQALQPKARHRLSPDEVES
jgi:hypothetical protein